ncbi:Nitronate monooxygenase [Roseivivax sp. THAF40]|uniref:NAD(P)H-dependent flavin oxidoreductase n=1 Tax=unclassified Roseivivax TaxID=2639302 RepID=UPI001267EF0B|nr:MULTISPECIES: nitronate monooxygenase [unclassified Roseivivax]QFS81749.1 Nitronate monooxygenase [Roseivivax sp. THAF197b]QFT45549.1 Nitronate monooxygenase [Roseivivax sp. THAF40]
MKPADRALATPLTRQFDLRLPVLAGGLMWLADAEYCAAAAKAGVLPFITAASFPDDGALRAEIARCRDMAAGRPFGVNVSMLPKLVPGEKTEGLFRLIIDEGIEVVETSGRNPEPYVPLLKEAGVTIIHKVPSVRYAVKAQSVGVDMVAIVGAECGGHPGMDLVGSLVNIALAERRLEIPFLIGGGIGAGSQIVAALAGGAAGVVIGTRFLAATELQAHDGYKQALVAASERDTALTMGSVRNTIRTLKNETTEIVAEMERTNPEIGIDALMPYVSGKIGRQAYETGDVSRGMLSAGQSLGLLDRSEPFTDIVASLEAEALAALARLRP